MQSRTISTFIPETHTHLTQTFIKKSQTFEMVMRIHVMWIGQSIYKMMTFQHSLLIHPIQQNKKIQNFFQLLNTDLSMQFPSMTEQCLIFRTKIPFPRTIWIRNRNWWPLNHSYRHILHTSFWCKRVSKNLHKQHRKK